MFIGNSNLFRVVTQRALRPVRRKINRKTEDITERINPSLAKNLRKINEKIENLEDTYDNFIDANTPFNVTIRQIKRNHNYEAGDHLIVQRIGYTHHGLYVGFGEVIHYLQDRGVCLVSLDEFAQGSNIHIRNSLKLYDSEIIVSRARSRLGENSYNLLANNCENFVNWCRSGR